MSASAYVGRVGGLAAALGIGAVIVFGATPSAWAEPADTAQSGADATASAAPAPRSPGRHASRAANTSARSGNETPVGKQSVRPAAIPAGPALSRILPRVPAGAGSATAVTAEPVSVPTTTITVTAPVPVAAPATVAQTAVATSAASLPDRALGGDPLAPLASPLSWAVMAVARRSNQTAKTTAAANADSTSSVFFNVTPSLTYTLDDGQSTAGVVTGTVIGTDPDSSPLSYSVTTGPSHGSVALASDGSFTYTPNESVAATGTTDSFTVTVTDAGTGFHLHGIAGLLNLLTFGLFGSSGHNAAGTVTLTVAPFLADNTAPVAGTVTVDTPNASTGVVTGTVTATDADGDTLTYTGSGATSMGSVIVASDGGFTYTPTDDARASATDSTTDSFTVTADDGRGGTAAIGVTVPVTPQTVVANTVTYVFNYTSGARYWSETAKESLQSSADRLAAYFVVSQPVTLTFNVTATDDEESGTLASTGSDLISSDSGFFNTVVQYKLLTGEDANGSAADGDIDVNFGIDWAYGDSVRYDQYDFTSTMMHELLHAYGFMGYIDEAGYNYGTTWTTFDSFMGTSSSVRVISATTYRFNPAYNANLTGGAGGLYFIGPNAIAAYGAPVPIFTPNPWESGSSGSHLDDDTFTGADAQLMNAYADSGLGIRVLSDIELGILEDIGYTTV